MVGDLLARIIRPPAFFGNAAIVLEVFSHTVDQEASRLGTIMQRLFHEGIDKPFQLQFVEPFGECTVFSAVLEQAQSSSGHV